MYKWDWTVTSRVFESWYITQFTSLPIGDLQVLQQSLANAVDAECWLECLPGTIHIVLALDARDNRLWYSAGKTPLCSSWLITHMRGSRNFVSVPEICAPRPRASIKSVHAVGDRVRYGLTDMSDRYNAAWVCFASARQGHGHLSKYCYVKNSRRGNHYIKHRWHCGGRFRAM